MSWIVGHVCEADADKEMVVAKNATIIMGRIFIS